jgi:hypothetical protein
MLASYNADANNFPTLLGRLQGPRRNSHAEHSMNRRFERNCAELPHMPRGRLRDADRLRETRGGDDGWASMFSSGMRPSRHRPRWVSASPASPMRHPFRMATGSGGGCCPRAAFSPRRQNDRQRSDGAAHLQRRAPLMEVSGSITLDRRARDGEYAGARLSGDKFDARFSRMRLRTTRRPPRATQ